MLVSISAGTGEGGRGRGGGGGGKRGWGGGGGGQLKCRTFPAKLGLKTSLKQRQSLKNIKEADMWVIFHTSHEPDTPTPPTHTHT